MRDMEMSNMPKSESYFKEKVFNLDNVKDELLYLKGRGVNIHFFDLPKELGYFNINLKWEYCEDFNNLYIHSQMPQDELNSKIRDYVYHFKYKVDREICERLTIGEYFHSIKDTIEA